MSKTARGRLLRTKIKEARELTKAEILAKGRAEQKLELNKKWELTAKEYLAKMIEKVDPLKLGAVLSVTYIIKTGIDFSQDVFLNIVRSPYAGIFLIPKFASDLFSMIPSKEIVKSNEALEWFLSFGVAYLLVENFDKIIETGGDILNIAKTFLGAKAIT